MKNVPPGAGVPLFGTSTRFFFNRIILLVTLSAALVIVLGVFASRSLDTLNAGNDWVTHAQQVRYQLAHVQQLLLDLGSGGRRYEMTHDPKSFQDAEAAAARLPAELATLNRLVAEDAGLPSLAAQLTDATRQRMTQAQTLMGMERDGDLEGTRMMVARGDTLRVLDLCRSLIIRMQDAENHLLRIHSDRGDQARKTVAFAIVATTALAVALLMLVAYVSMRHSARLQRVQNDLSTTLRSIGDAVISTDPNGRVRFMNPVAEQLTGWTDAEAQGRFLDDVFRIINEKSRTAVESPVARVLRDRTVVGLANHTLLLDRQGGERPIEDSGAPIYSVDGALVGVVLVFRDATVSREAQRSLIDNEAALREADRRKDVFLATLSHELRNPLAPIRNAARLLESPALTNEELARSRMIISRQVRHMASLLDDLLDVSRITRGMLTLKKEVVELRGLVEAAVETSRPLIDAKRHALQVDWPAAGMHIEADPLRLTQVITNLLTNAAKYTDPEGHIGLDCSTRDRAVVIRVRDDGIGLAGDMLTKVFEMFSQVAPDTGHADGGLGIGLALVKGLVELHGGHVEARSAGLEHGSEFLIVLPEALADPRVDSLASVEADTLPVAAKALRVLVADDNRDSAESLGMLLELCGHEVFLAHTGVDALSVAADRKPDAALLDIGMPGMNGYEVAAHVRREPWGKSMTLIAITGWGQEDNKRMAREAGFDHHLTKPMDTAVLEKLLSDIARPG